MKKTKALGKYYRKNRKHMLSYQNDYNEQNRGYVYMMNAGRMAKKKYGTECATDEAELKAMGQIYQKAIDKTRETGTQYVVDHIHPLCRGGKHELKNLQVLTASENARKYHTSDKHLPHPDDKNITINIENATIVMSANDYLKIVEEDK